MRKFIFKGFLFFSMVLMAEMLSSCMAPKTSHCPGVSSTGNYAATHRGPRVRRSAGACAGTTSTGTIKPKQKNKTEDGLYSPKMQRAMEKANKKEGTGTAQ